MSIVLLRQPLKSLSCSRMSSQSPGQSEGSLQRCAAARAAAPKKQKNTDGFPPSSHQDPFQRPLLMAVRRWRLMHRAANPSSLGQHILTHSRMLLSMVEHSASASSVDTQNLQDDQPVATVPRGYQPSSHVSFVMKSSG